jgi:uncharacterized protein
LITPNIPDVKKLSLLLLFLPLTIFAQDPDSTWIVNNYTKKEVLIPMRDGIKLFTAIYTPKDQTTKHPILMERTPYSCAPYGSVNFKANFWKRYTREYLKKNYIMVIQDVRGRWMSEGNFMDVRPFNPNKKTNKDIDEASDTYDTIDWLVKNTINNGNVGVYGISYPGFYATMAALSNHPALKAVSPQAPVTNWFLGDDWHHNGALFLMDAFSFYEFGGFDAPHPKPTSIGAKGLTPPKTDLYSFYLKTGALPNFTKLAGDSSRFWNEMMAHPNMDAWWKQRDATTGIANLKPALLVVGGFFDAEDCFGALATYRAAVSKSPRSSSKLVMGPWYHGGWNGGEGKDLGSVQFQQQTSAYYQQNLEIPFFEQHLNNKSNTDSIAGATIFFSGENKWRKFAKWPVSEASTHTLFLANNGKLTMMPGQPMLKVQPSFSEYTSDPAKPVPYNNEIMARRVKEYMINDQRFASQRPDVVTFETDILGNDVTLAGPLVADLMVSISTTDADFVVKLIDVFPDDFSYSDKDNYPMAGYQMLVRGEIMRGKFRNSFEKPEPFIPDSPTRVKYTLPDVAHTFKKGHRMMVQVQSSWFPLADRNPQQFMDIYHAKDSDFKKATVKIHHYASKITVPVLPTAE